MASRPFKHGMEDDRITWPPACDAGIGRCWTVLLSTCRSLSLCGWGSNALVLATVMTKKVITARETFGIRATRNVTVVSCLSSILFQVLSFVTGEVLRVEESLVAGWASMRSLVTAEMDLEMTAILDQH